MADFNLDAVNALRSKLFKILTSSNTPRGTFLSFIPAGLPQSDYTLKFLTDPSAIEPAFDFSLVVNSVPVSTGDWVQSPSLIWDLYKDWLDRYEAAPFSLTPDEQSKLDYAANYVDEKYDAYDTYKAKWDNAYFEWQGLVLMPSEDRPPNYNTELAKAKKALEKAKKDWDIRGHKAEFETQYAIMQDLSERDPIRTKQRLKDKFGEPLTAPGGDYYPTRIAPANLLAPDFEWPRFTFSQSEIHEYRQDNSYSWGGGAQIGSLLWSAGVNTSGKREFHEQKTDISNMSLEFDLIRAPILRPWFSNFLLISRAWKWRQSTPDDPSGGDPFSNGNLPAEGRWQMIPTEAILVRNLRVKLDMSSQVNRESLTETKSSFEGGYGPFKIKGQVQTSNGTKSYDFKEEKDGITCEQPQIVAFFCTLMPKLPNPNWALWKE